MLSTSVTAKERDDLGAEVGAGLASIGQALATLQRYADPADADDSARLRAFSAAVGTWSGHLRDFVTLVQAQPLELPGMTASPTRAVSSPRVLSDLFWLGRYAERAEFTARLLTVTRERVSTIVRRQRVSAAVVVPVPSGRRCAPVG